eukprot:gnl/TRDRNA2_/TRDRNA2_172615_c2_seq2.p1 gnl/TRDRNA2_/TRDRNA2_172615_c2~~gnl/TRDRNA2_/TRDRNA2_172615_c2_seq2.p1  ORF type:complete len:324 (+),score=18.42 gnl/TRDRNA2_/TRDRNA2_172615_c2_seq2:197-1168(+)
MTPTTTMTTLSTTTTTAPVACVRDASPGESDHKQRCSDDADFKEGFMGSETVGRFYDPEDEDYKHKCWMDKDVPVACCQVLEVPVKGQTYNVCCSPMQECSAACPNVQLNLQYNEKMCRWPCRRQVSFDVKYELSIDYNLQLSALDTSTVDGAAPHFQSADGYHVQRGKITHGLKAAIAEMFRDRGVSRESLILVNSSLSPSEGNHSSTSHQLFLKIDEIKAVAQDTTILKPVNFFGYKDLTCAYFADEFEKYLRYFNCGDSEDYCLPLDGLVVKRVAGQMSYSMEVGELVVGLVGQNHVLPLASVSLSVMAALFMSLLVSCR